MYGGGRLAEKFDRAATRALMAFPAQGAGRSRRRSRGWLAGRRPAGWRVRGVAKAFAAKVKTRAGGGPIRICLAGGDVCIPRHTAKLLPSRRPKPRAIYHDSYEYKSDWSPELFAQFEKRRGYDCRTNCLRFRQGGDDRVSRGECDYARRRPIS
jgi:hypothetical protein